MARKIERNHVVLAMIRSRKSSGAHATRKPRSADRQKLRREMKSISSD